MSADNNNGIEFLEAQLAANPDSMLFARLADEYLGMNRIEEAITLCEKGIKKHPYYATGHFVLGKTYLANEMYEQAEKEFKRVLLFDPKFLAAHKYYGDLMKEIGWENTCETSYKKILQIDPLDSVARSMVDVDIAEASEQADIQQESEASDSHHEQPELPDPMPDQALEMPAELPDEISMPDIDEPVPDTEAKEDVAAMPDPFADLPEPVDFEQPAPNPSISDPVEADQPEGSTDPLSDLGLPLEPKIDESEPEDNIDLNVISPMPVSAEEEELLFKDPEIEEPDEAPLPDESVMGEKEEISEPAIPGLEVAEPDLPEVESEMPAPAKEETDLDDAKAEEFSYILDDIFRDSEEDDYLADIAVPETPDQPEDSKESAMEEQPVPATPSAHPQEALAAEQSQAAIETHHDFADQPELQEPSLPDEEEKENDDVNELRDDPLNPAIPSTPNTTVVDGLPLESVEPPVETSEPLPKPKAKKRRNNTDKIVTPTLGEIYAAQGQYSKAIDVFETLIQKNPDNEFYIQKIEVLKRKLAEANNAS